MYSYQCIMYCVREFGVHGYQLSWVQELAEMFDPLTPAEFASILTVMNLMQRVPASDWDIMVSYNVRGPAWGEYILEIQTQTPERICVRDRPTPAQLSVTRYTGSSLPITQTLSCVLLPIISRSRLLLYSFPGGRRRLGPLPYCRCRLRC